MDTIIYLFYLPHLSITSRYIQAVLSDLKFMTIHYRYVHLTIFINIQDKQTLYTTVSI
jgi:hypothetical protein